MFLDGHSSHFSLHLSTFCREKGIILIGLIPNATHLLQPMDVSLFHPLKSEWKKIIHEWRINNNGERLKREDFSGLVNECLQRAVKPETIRNGFRICGLYPFDVNAVPFEKLLKTTADDSEKTESEESEPREKNEEDIRSILSFIESMIGVERLEEFKRCEKDQWNGQTKDEGLFNFWLDIKKKIPDSSLQNMSISENNQQEHNTTLEANINFSVLGLDENFAENGVIDLDINGDGSVVISTPKSSCADTLQIFQQINDSPISNLTEQRDENANNLENFDKQTPITQKKGIPSPFKNALFWPDTPVSTTKSGKVKRKITPSVAVADEFMAYQIKLKKEKDEKLSKSKSKAKGKKKSNGNEDENVKNSMTDANTTEITKGDYVVILYEGEKFPGLVLDIEGPKFKIKTMAMAMGIQNRWKWLDKDDILVYEREEII